MLEVFLYLTGVCVVSCRSSLPKNISITVWRPGDWGPQAGPSCSWAFSSPCASSTHWVNIDPLAQRRSPRLLFLTFSAPCLQWTGFPSWESWCLWGWSSSPCARRAPCLFSPSRQVGFFTVRWWLRLWRRSLWSRCSWPAQDFQPKSTSDCLKGNDTSRGSGTCDNLLFCYSVFVSQEETPSWCSHVPPLWVDLDLLKWRKTFPFFFFGTLSGHHTFWNAKELWIVKEMLLHL